MKPDNRFDTHNGEHRFEWDSGHRIEPVFEMTKAYIDELEASVEYLRKENIDWEDTYRELAGRYNKLRELVGIMRTCIKHACLCDFCPLFAAEDMDEPRCIAEMDSRMRELGVDG